MTASNVQRNGHDKNSSAKEERKLRKPLIEKRRRERINCSLEQLKGIMVDAYNLDQSKLEKADVLEVTVQHMDGLQKGHGPGSPTGPRVGSGFEARQRYSTGYIQCMHEVHNLLLSCPGMDKTLGARLLNHLLKSLPHLSTDTGNTGSSGGSSNVVVVGGGGPLPGSSPGSGTGPGTPPHSTLSLPTRRLLLQPPPPSSSPTCPPPNAPKVSLRDGEDSGVKEQPPASPPPIPPRLPQSGVALAPHPVLPQFFPGGDPSMWRPW